MCDNINNASGWLALLGIWSHSVLLNVFRKCCCQNKDQPRITSLEQLGAHVAFGMVRCIRNIAV
jgi:hypothetical protein